jgi:hypothetical protein
MKKILRSILLFFGLQPKSNYYSFVTRATVILEKEYGHFESCKQQSCIKGSEIIPWITYPALEYISQIDFSDKTLLEWGAGNSSIYFSKRFKHLTSIEHNKNWFVKIKEFGLKNQNLIFADKKNYLSVVQDLETKFDVILIDAILRDDCVAIAPALLNNNGLIILDNSDRHPGLCEKLRKDNFIQVDMHGFGPINNYTWTTTFFFTRMFDFNPINIQPIIPIGGGY